MIIPDKNIFFKKGATGSEKTIAKHYPDFYKFICDKYPIELSWKEKLYWYYNNISNHPRCECGKYVSFINFVDGYHKYCCSKCVYNSIDFKKSISVTHKSKTNKEKENINKKRKNTLISKYGCLTPGLEKAKQTNLKKYGVENVFASEKIKNIIKQTNLKKYGVIHPMQSEAIKTKLQNTLLQKYGVEHYKQLSEFNTYISVEDAGQEMRKRKCPHPDCKLCKEKWYEVSDGIYHDRKQNKIEPCTRIYPIQKFRNHNTSIEKFIQNILVENNIEFKTGNKNILNGHELDVYIPSHKLAIECNGVYWHSTQNNTPHNKHWDKYKKCKELGVQLLTFWEDQIKLYPEKIEQILLSKLGIFNKRIGASKCKIIEITYKESSEFINQYHLQGAAQGECIRIGLKYKDELVSVMTFGHTRYTKSGGWELYRYCSKKGFQIIGGATRLLSYFEKHYHPNILESFSSNDISNGGIYKQLGFKLIDEYIPSYWYIQKTYMKRYHRSHFTKSNLIKMGYDSSKSEYQLTNELGYYRIFDCGQSKYIKKY